jgi:hypothetical protein
MQRLPPGALAARPLVRRDAECGERTAPSWESLTERLIREAMDEGAFLDLPYQGRPLPLGDSAHAGEMASACLILRNAGFAPPWIEADKEVRRLETEIEALAAQARRAGPAARRRAELLLDELLDRHASAVDRLAVLAPTTRQHRRHLDRSAVIARLGTTPR